MKLGAPCCKSQEDDKNVIKMGVNAFVFTGAILTNTAIYIGTFK